MTHNYQAVLEWNNANEDLNVRTFSRNHKINFNNKPELQLTADPTFRGDKSLLNPEELLLAAISSCHLLSYLYRCATTGVVVISYSDNATGTMITDGSGSGKFTEIILHPTVIVKDASMIDKAIELHHQANKDCFIANSVNFAIRHQPVAKVNTD